MSILPAGFLGALRAGGISARLLPIYFQAIPAPTLSVSLVSHYLMSQSLRAEQDNRLTMQNNVLVSVLDGFIESPVTAMAAFARGESLEKFVTSYNDLVFEELVSEFGNFDHFLVAAPSRITESVHDDAGSTNPGLNVSTTGLFRQAVQAPNRVHIGSAENTAIAENGIYLGYFRVSYFGEEIAFVQNRSAGRALKAKVDGFAVPAGYHRLVGDRRGFIIYASEPRWIGRVLPSDQRLALKQNSGRVHLADPLDRNGC